MTAQLGVAVVTAAATWLSLVLVVASRPRATAVECAVVVAASAAVSSAISAVIWPGRPVFVPVAVTAVAVTGISAWHAVRRPGLTTAGSFAWVTWLGFGGLTLLWGLLFLAGLSLSLPSTVLLWTALGLSLLTMPSAVVTTREGWEPLLSGRRHDDRRRRPPLVTRAPRVSIHVPCHAEPPEIVIATLDRIARLDYPDFEVLVVDNNTVDPDLWEPVAAHCRRLGDRFRFFHVEGITGAKAGALNWVLPHADPAAALVAVVDADYHVEPSWLADTVGHFSDPRMGFVQAPHAYRAPAGARFASWASWEYAVFFRTGMVSLDRHGAGLTVGTMSLLRRSALVEAGGWAEWCLTEDSELAIRIHAAGYDSVYLTEIHGRGLVPHTFEDYRRQRFRWTYGPVQEFRHHWRLFLPRFLGGRASELTTPQRLHHANHGIDVMGIGIRALALVVGAAAALAMVVQQETVRMPFELWLSATVALVGSWIVRLLVFRRVVGASIGQALGAITAFASLSLIITVASIRASLGLPAAWQRTSKFQARSSLLSALASARQELAVAGCFLAGGVALLVLPAAPSGLVVMMAIALLVKATTFLAAPLMAVVADRDLTRIEPVFVPQLEAVAA